MSERKKKSTNNTKKKQKQKKNTEIKWPKKQTKKTVGLW